MPYDAYQHIDTYLQNIAFGYPVQNLIGDMLAPVVPVDKRSDYYPVYGPEFMAIPTNAGIVAPGAPTLALDYGVSATQYLCVGHGFHVKIPVEVRANTDLGADNQRRNALFQTKQVTELMREKSVSTLLQTAGTYSGTTTAVGASTAKWGNASTVSHPIRELFALRTLILNASGINPNTAWFSQDVWNVFINHADVIDRTKYTSRDQITAAMAADLLEVDNVYIGRGVYNAANEGQTKSISPIWTNTCGLCYKGPQSASQGAEDVSSGSFAQFVWHIPEIQSGPDGSIVQSWYETKERSEYIEYMKYSVPKTTFQTSAGALTAVLS